MTIFRFETVRCGFSILKPQDVDSTAKAQVSVTPMEKKKIKVANLLNRTRLLD